MKIIGMIIFFLLSIQEAFAFIPVTAPSNQPPQRSSRCFFDLLPQMRSKPKLPQKCLTRVRPEEVSRLIKSIPPIAKPQSLTRNLPSIHAIFIRGGVDLTLSGGSSNKIRLKNTYPGLSIRVCSNGLYICNPRPVDCNQNPRPVIRLQVQDLRELVVAGNSCVKGACISTPCGLTITNCGSGQICLYGPVRLVRVSNTGNGEVCVHNVCTDHLQLLGTRNGSTRLTGSTDLLLIRAFEKSTVDTRCMHSKTAMVQANDQSLVMVRTACSLQAFAGGMSNIYYYGSPGLLLQHNALSGNVLPMARY